MIFAVCQDGMQKQIKNKKNCLFAECNGPLHSAKGLFAECHGPVHSAKLGREPLFLPIFPALPSARVEALGKEFSKKKIISLLSASQGGTRQRIFFKKN